MERNAVPGIIRIVLHCERAGGMLNCWASEGKQTNKKEVVAVPQTACRVQDDGDTTMGISQGKGPGSKPCVRRRHPWLCKTSCLAVYRLRVGGVSVRRKRALRFVLGNIHERVFG